MHVNWSAIDNRSILGKALRLPLQALPKKMVMTIHRGPAKGMKWIAGSSTHGCWLGTYELDKQRVLESFVKAGMTVYDIGAQAGFYTLFFSRLVGRGKVYAIEPYAENIQYLLTHIRMNSAENVHTIQAALAEHTGLVGFTVDQGSCQNFLTHDTEALLLIPTLSLDVLVETCDLAPPDLIKMDVEGAESAVLQGAHKVLERYRPVLFIALHSHEQKHLCQAFLEGYKYAIYSLEGQPIVGTLKTDEIYALPHEAGR